MLGWTFFILFSLLVSISFRAPFSSYTHTHNQAQAFALHTYGHTHILILTIHQASTFIYSMYQYRDPFIALRFSISNKLLFA